jgi:hypothetical protein
VGLANTAARYYLSNHIAVRRLLGELCEAGTPVQPREAALASSH